MSLANLLNVPQTPEEWELWGFAHDQNHQQMLAAVRAQGGPALTQYQLYPFAPDGTSDFLERNQHSHSDINAVLGLNSSDLQDADFNNRQQLVAWIALHHAEHFNMNAKLGIS